jgi:hypothetical protein
MGSSLILDDLLPYLVCDREEELTAKTQVDTETLCEILRRVFGVVDVPFKLVSHYYTVDADVEFNHSYGLSLIHRLVWSRVGLENAIDLLLHLVDYLNLE